jgi:hypothetical protein
MPTVAVAAVVAVVAEVVGTTGVWRDAQDLMTPVEGEKGPPWILRYK